MDINLPLILFLAVAFTGLAWLFDLVFLRKERMAALQGIEDKFADLTEEDKLRDEAFINSYEAVAKEPAVIEYSKSFFPVLLIVFVIRSFIVEPFQIPSESMVPTLEVGDFIVVNKFTYGIRLPIIRTKVLDINEPERGEVMVFFPPGEDRYFIKRVIGLPGDRISYSNKVLTVNGKEWTQTLIGEDFAHKPDPCEVYSGGTNLLHTENSDGKEHVTRYCDSMRHNNKPFTVVVPEGKYFMMGDNRDNSEDSRAWGFASEERIVGRAFAIWMHKEPGWHFPTFSRAGAL